MFVLLENVQTNFLVWWIWLHGWKNGDKFSLPRAFKCFGSLFCLNKKIYFTIVMKRIYLKLLLWTFYIFSLRYICSVFPPKCYCVYQIVHCIWSPGTLYHLAPLPLDKKNIEQKKGRLILSILVFSSKFYLFKKYWFMHI